MSARHDPAASGDKRLIALMCVAEIFATAGFATYPALLPRLVEVWSLSNSEAGIIGGVLFLGYVLAVPFLTSLTDRVDARSVYLCSTLVMCLGSGFFALVADGFFGALVGQLVFGMGFAGVYMPGLKALSDRVDERRQSWAATLYTSVSGIGLGGSFALAGWAAHHFGWRWGFGLAAFGPLVACALVSAGMARRAAAAVAPGSWLGNLRKVFANRPALGYILAYTAHCWELYGVRSWMVAFLVFVEIRLYPDAVDPHEDAATVVGVITLIGIATSICTNDIALRLGRARVVIATLTLSVLFSLGFGLSWALPFWLTVVLAGIYYGIVMADSGAITAGTVATATVSQRGATLAIHSTFGFTAGLAAPAVFGVILDLGGGSGVPLAWAAAFFALGLPGLLGALAVRSLSAPPAARRDAAPQLPVSTIPTPDR